MCSCESEVELSRWRCECTSRTAEAEAGGGGGGGTSGKMPVGEVSMWMGVACRERPAEEEKAEVLCSGADALRVTAVWWSPTCMDDEGCCGCCCCMM